MGVAVCLPKLPSINLKESKPENGGEGGKARRHKSGRLPKREESKRYSGLKRGTIPRWIEREELILSFLPFAHL